MDYHSLNLGIRIGIDEINKRIDRLKKEIADSYEYGDPTELKIKVIAPVPGINSERAWIAVYDGITVILHDAGNCYWQYVDCLTLHIDNYIEDAANKIKIKSLKDDWNKSWLEGDANYKGGVN